MMDDMFCDISDMDHLKSICTKNKLASCHSCWWCSPNSGYDVPYCFKRTSLGQGKGKSCLGSYNPPIGSKDIPWNTPPFKLELGNIPKTCRYWKSKRKESDRLQTRRDLKYAQELINKLPKSARKKLKI